MGGHLGMDKTLGRLKERFYWPGHHNDVQEWCRNCVVCAQRKSPSTKPRAPLQPITTSYPLQLVATDIMGLLPKSPSGNYYILVAIIKEVCQLLGVRKSRTTPYHPQSDGLVERFNCTLLDMLATAVSDRPFEWELHLRRLCHAYNTSIRPTTGFSPFFLMFGRQTRMPADIMLGTSTSTSATLPKYVTNLCTSLESAYKDVREHMGHKQELQKVRYDS